MTEMTTVTKVDKAPNLPTSQPSDLLVRAFEQSGFKVGIEDGPKGDDVATVFVTVSEQEKRANGTLGPITRFIIEKSTGNILGLKPL